MFIFCCFFYVGVCGPLDWILKNPEQFRELSNVITAYINIVVSRNIILMGTIPLREYMLLKSELVKDQSLRLDRAWTTCLIALQQRHCFTALWFCCRHQAVCFFLLL